MALTLWRTLPLKTSFTLTPGLAPAVGQPEWGPRSYLESGEDGGPVLRELILQKEHTLVDAEVRIAICGARHASYQTQNKK